MGKLRDYAFLLLLADTGLRVSEVCSLNLNALPHPKASKLKTGVPIKGGDEALFTESEDERQPGQRGHLTPHSLRHYFVTKVWRKTGDIRTAQKLARHKELIPSLRLVAQQVLPTPG